MEVYFVVYFKYRVESSLLICVRDSNLLSINFVFFIVCLL